MDKKLTKYVHKGRTHPLQLTCVMCLTRIKRRGVKKTDVAAEAAKAGWGVVNDTADGRGKVLCPTHYADYLEGRITDESLIRNRESVDEKVRGEKGKKEEPEKEKIDGTEKATTERGVEDNGKEKSETKSAENGAEKSGETEGETPKNPPESEGDRPGNIGDK